MADDRNLVRFVTTQADQEPAAEEATAETTEPAAADEPAAESAAAESAAAESAAAESAATEPAATEPAATEPAATEPASEGEPTAEVNPEPKYRPFEEVREQVAQTMVEEDARNARDAAVSKARAVMRQYSRKRSIYEADKSQPQPADPNLKALADELGLQYSKIGPHDPVSLEVEPIYQSVEEGTALSQRGVPFTALMFGVPGQVNKQEVFTPVVTVDLQTEQTYLAWKTAEKEAYLPELDEIRDEVKQAIRVAKARDLAKQAAEALAEKADSAATLEELVPEDRKDNYFKDLGPFSWLNMVGFGNFTIGNVPELDAIDEEFMKAVFNAKAGDHVVAANGPKRVYYVIKRTSLLPATSDLRAIFAQPQERVMAMFMPDSSAMEIQQGFIEAVDKETGFERYQLPE